MKRIIKITFSSLIISLITLSMVIGQEKKTEQKIKIIVDDGSGKKVLVDTVHKDNHMTDSLKLKDGTVIFIGQPENDYDIRPDDRNEQVFVTVSDDGKETKKIVKKITIANSDSAKWNDERNNSRIYVYNDSNNSDGKHAEQHKIIHYSDKYSNDPDEKVIIINNRKKIGKEGEETIEYTVKSGDKESDGERTKYVINKNGMVITIEGEDYNKVKELVKEVESKLDSQKDGSVKAEPKKGVKK